MQTLLKELNHPHPGAGRQVDLQVYRLLTLITALLSFLVVIPANYFQHLPVQVNVAIMIFGSVMVSLYFGARRQRMYPAFFFFAVLVLLNYVWFFNAGSEGSVPFYFFAEIIYLVFFFRGRERLLSMTLVLANVMLLIYGENWVDGMLVPFSSPDARTADLMIGFLTSGIACCLVLWVLVSTYDREHERSRHLNSELAEVLELNLQKTAELEKSLAEIKTLRGLLPICACCKKIRDDQGLWTRVEEYISHHTEAEFSHGLCPECYQQEIKKLEAYQG